jgi:hypothetical protein
MVTLASNACKGAQATCRYSHSRKLITPLEALTKRTRTCPSRDYLINSPVTGVVVFIPLTPTIVLVFRVHLISVVTGSIAAFYAAPHMGVSHLDQGTTSEVIYKAKVTPNLHSFLLDQHAVSHFVEPRILWEAGHRKSGFGIIEESRCFQTWSLLLLTYSLTIVLISSLGSSSSAFVEHH